jgi:hypothetical protein
MKEVKVPLYGFRIFFCNDESELRDYIKKNAPDPETALPGKDRFLGLCPDFQGKDGCKHRIMAIVDGNMSTLAHEATHMAFIVLEAAGITVEADNNEALAYLVDWLFAQFIVEFPDMEWTKGQRIAS